MSYVPPTLAEQLRASVRSGARTSRNPQPSMRVPGDGWLEDLAANRIEALEAEVERLSAILDDGRERSDEPT